MVVGLYHREHRGRNEKQVEYLVSALSDKAYTVALYVIINRMKGGGRARPTLTSMG